MHCMMQDGCGVAGAATVVSTATGYRGKCEHELLVAWASIAWSAAQCMGRDLRHRGFALQTISE
jgi:hypothetical protein